MEPYTTHQILKPETLHQRRRPHRLEGSLLVSFAFNPVPDASNERNCHLPQRNPTYSEAVDELLVRGVLACGSFGALPGYLKESRNSEQFPHRNSGPDLGLHVG